MHLSPFKYVRGLTVILLCSSSLIFAQIIEAGIGGSDCARIVLPAADEAPTVRGPIESFDPITNTLLSLGQNIRLSSNTIFVDQGMTISTSNAKLRMANGHGEIVEVYGSLSPDGSLTAKTLVLTNKALVHGSSVVRLQGKITKLDADLARLSVGSLQADFTQSLYDGIPLGMRVGSLIELTGTLDATAMLFADLVVVSGTTLLFIHPTASIDIARNLTSTNGIGGGDKAIRGISGSD